MSDQPPPYDETTDGMLMGMQAAQISTNGRNSNSRNSTSINNSNSNSQLTEQQVAAIVREMGSSEVWRGYADMCLSKHLDGRTVCEATIEDLIDVGFEKIHARAVIHFFQPYSVIADNVARLSEDYTPNSASTTTANTRFSVSDNSVSSSSSSSSASCCSFDSAEQDSVPAVIFHTVVDKLPELPAQVPETKEQFPFSHAVHIYSPPRTEVQIEQAQRLREEISKTEVYLSDPFAPHFCSDDVLHRFLRARQYDYTKAFTLLLETILWRASYRPQDILGAQLPNTGRTGKVFSHPIRDKWGRPILVLNNTKENCKDWDENIRWLTFQLERGRKAMEIDHARTGAALVEKWIVFIHLTEFSLWNNPPWKVTSETLKLFTSRYPEFLGHAVLFEAPSIFSGLFSLCTPFLDEVTKNKVVWIKGECGEGETNDLHMKSLIGPDWKTITGAFQPVVTRNASPGFDFDKFWQGLLLEEKEWWKLHREYAAQMNFTFPIGSDDEIALEQKVAGLSIFNAR